VNGEWYENKMEARRFVALMIWHFGILPPGSVSFFSSFLVADSRPQQDTQPS
jgi:hypothetical protein